MQPFYYVYLKTSYNHHHMKKFLFSTALLFSAGPLFAQADPVGDFNKHVLANWNGNYYRVSQYRVKGTPFLFGQSFPGTIDFKDGKTVKGINVLYDLHTQASGIDLKNWELFEAEQGVKKFTVDLPQHLGGKRLVFINADAYHKDYKGYYNLLADGDKAALLKAYKIKMLPDPTNHMVKDIRVFEQYFEYYIFDKATKQLHKVKLKEKDILNGLPSSDLAIGYIRAHNLDLTNENDAAQFISSFNANFK